MIQRKLEVTYLPYDRTTRVPAGTTVFSAAHWIGLPIDSTCGGRGTCGKCKVRVIQGRRDAETADHRQLRPSEIEDGWRLSCQARVYEDMTCEVPQLLRVPKAATMGLGRLVILDPNVRKVYLELSEPSMEDQRSDVARLRDALTEEGHDMVAGVAVLRTLPPVFREAGFRVTAVLAGEQLVAVEAGDTTAECYGVAFDVGATTLVAAREIGLQIHPHGYIQTLPALGAYVGADIVAGVLATGVAREDRIRVFVDVGTNGEIVLGSAQRALATAAPAGPAFEGSQIKCGMRATVGAIEGVQLGDRVELQVIGGDVRAEGICGSGLVDAVAQLLLAGLLDYSGRFKKPEDVPDHPLRDRLIDVDGMRAFLLADGVYLTQRDIRELQFAKGSIATGIKVLMDILGVTAGDLDQVLLGGSFGSYLNPESAKIIGLVPPVEVDRIIAVGNSAGEGAKIALLSYRERQVAFELPSRIEYVELSGRSDFNDAFISVLGFPELAPVT